MLGIPAFYPARKINCKSFCRRLGFSACILGALLTAAQPVYAQDISILRDTETEEMLGSYETPLAKAAGLDPAAVKLYLVGDTGVNAFVAEGRGGYLKMNCVRLSSPPLC